MIEVNKTMNSLIDKQVKACIHCGMCLPACPTYRVSGNEGNSPRGRIYLISDLINNSDDFTKENYKEVVEYLDNCLSCYACETVCPSGVQYASILDYARNDLDATQYNLGFFASIRFLVFNFLLPNRYLLTLVRNFLEKTSLFMDFLSFIIPQFKTINKLKPSFDHPYKRIKTNHIYYSDVYLKDINLETRTISFPLGCVMDTIYNHVHWDTIYVLNQFGYHVFIPNTSCCGSLAAHSGEIKIGLKQLKLTLSTFRHDGYPVVINSAGCGAFIKEHENDYDPDSKVGNIDVMKHLNFKHNNLEIMDLVTALIRAPHNPLKEKKQRQKLVISYHPACHLNHRQGVAWEYLDLIKQIPNLELEELRDAELCCGSAGFYNLIRPEMADKIGDEKAKNIQDTQAKIIVSANPGCISQIQAHLGKEYRVVHPATLIADYLRLN